MASMSSSSSLATTSFISTADAPARYRLSSFLTPAYGADLSESSELNRAQVCANHFETTTTRNNPIRIHDGLVPLAGT